MCLTSDSFQLLASCLWDAEVGWNPSQGEYKKKKMIRRVSRGSCSSRVGNTQLCLVFCPNVRVLWKWNVMMTVLDQQKTTRGFNISGWYDKRVWDLLIYSPKKGKWEIAISFFRLALWNISSILKWLQSKMMKVLGWTMNVRVSSDI